MAWTTPSPESRSGTALSATQLNATASYNGTAVAGTFAYSPAAGAMPGAGNDTLSVTFTPSDATHYTTATGTVTLAVSKATPVLTWPTPSPITTGTALSATQLNAAAALNGTAVAGTYAYNPAAGVVPALGSDPLSVTFTPTDTSDCYTTATGSVTLVVTNQSAPTITWADASGDNGKGTVLSATQLNATASFNGSSVAGTYAYTPAAGTVLGVGSQTLSVTFTPSNTAQYTNATGTVTLVVNPSVSGNQAAFAGIDTTTQGNWKGVYGGDGYWVATDTASLPTYVSDTTQTLVTGAGTYTWVTITTDPRAPQAGVGTGRIAATWFNSGASFSYDVNITDGQTHEVAVYALDWDTYQGGRIEQVQVVDGVSGAVLDTRTISSFTNGTYVYWNISGHVKINVTPTYSNGVISGIFFGNGNVVKSTPVVAWSTPSPITFGTALSGTQLNATASYNGTTVPGTFAYTPAAGAMPGAGSDTLSVTFTPTDTTHYTTATGTVSLAVSKATPVLTWPTPSPITTGTALSATQLNAAAALNGTAVAGTYAYTPTAGTVPAQGSDTLSVTFTPTDTSDYTTATGTVTLVVTNQSAPTITWATPAAITAGTALSATQLNAAATFNGSAVTGTYVYTPAAGTVLGVGSQTLSVVFTPSNTALYTNATGTVTLVVNPSVSGNQAAFAGIDTTTQGNWEGVYGGDGYAIATDTASLPTYVSDTTQTLVTGAGTYTWVTITTDPRAPQAGVGTSRVAATWFSGTTFSYDVNITDGGTHEVAVYALDWDTYQGGRIEQIQVLDGVSNAVLDSRTISSFTGGEYVYWNISGHVKINVTALYANAVISGIFFGNGNVVKSTPVVAWSTPSPITFGTALSATQLNATASYNGTTVAGTFAYTVRRRSAMPGAGSDTLSVTFTPTDTTDYTTATGTVTLAVSKATPVITWPTPSPITTGTALSATQLNAAAALNGTAVAGTFANNPAAGTVPGLGSDTLSVTFTPTDTSDYTTATASVTLVVTNQSAPTITWATPAAITAGTALSATQLNAAATFNGSAVTGTYAYTPAAGTVLGVGSQTLSVAFTPSNTALYTNATGTVTCWW